MSRPPKPYKLLKMEGKSNKTKAELKQRKQAEEAVLTGVALKERPEVRENPIAHKEFLRVRNLLGKIEKNDDIYGPVINRYCLLLAECVDFEEKKEKYYNLIDKITNDHEKAMDDMAPGDKAAHLIEYTKSIDRLSRNIISIDKQIQTKRRMLFDIEKENIMTIASALRSIPKEVKKEENPLLKALNG
jgi:hypothetical protein